MSDDCIIGMTTPGLDDFLGGRITFASGGGSGDARTYGSLYAIDPDAAADVNRGRRIRLMHGSGPEVSRTPSVRYSASTDVRRGDAIDARMTALGRADTEVPDGRRLVEVRVGQTAPAHVTHISRGGATAISLTDAQVRLILAVAIVDGDPDDRNEAMADLLRGTDFDGHVLQTYARRWTGS